MGLFDILPFSRVVLSGFPLAVLNLLVPLLSLRLSSSPNSLYMEAASSAGPDPASAHLMNRHSLNCLAPELAGTTESGAVTLSGRRFPTNKPDFFDSGEENNIFWTELRSWMMYHTCHDHVKAGIELTQARRMPERRW